jgi:hypothetical protein
MPNPTQIEYSRAKATTVHHNEAPLADPGGQDHHPGDNDIAAQSLTNDGNAPGRFNADDVVEACSCPLNSRSPVGIRLQD